MSLKPLVVTMASVLILAAGASAGQAPPILGPATFVAPEPPPPGWENPNDPANAAELVPTRVSACVREATTCRLDCIGDYDQCSRDSGSRRCKTSRQTCQADCNQQIRSCGR